MRKRVGKKFSNKTFALVISYPLYTASIIGIVTKTGNTKDNALKTSDNSWIWKICSETLRAVKKVIDAIKIAKEAQFPNDSDNILLIFLMITDLLSAFLSPTSCL